MADSGELVLQVYPAPEDNLNIHLAPELADFAQENQEWLRVYRLPAYAPDMNPAEMGLS
jgi:hypothetical protein